MPVSMIPGEPIGLQRAQNAKVVVHRDGTLVLGADGRVHRFPGDSGALVAEILRQLSAPISREALVARLAERFEDVAQNAGTLDSALEHLQKSGVLVAAHAHSHTHVTAAVRKLVLGVTGAVGTAMSPQLAANLVAAGYRVRIAMTKAAHRFVTPLALESLTHEAVVNGLWDRSKDLPTPHINLAEWADVVLVCPASATTIARLAQGDCSDLVSATAIAARCPVVVVPSMNAAMFEAPAVRRNLDLLRDDGFHLVMPAYGHEVAHAPEKRTPVMGPAPSPRDVIAMLDAVFALASVPRSSQMDAWDDRYRTFKPEQLPWHTDALDGDLIDVLSVLPKPNTVLDLGTGLGTVARELGKKGLTVTATDLSSVALSRAQTHLSGLPVTLVHDDITRTRLQGTFDLVVDRATLHVLPPEQHAAWAASIARLTAKGGHVVVKVHAEAEPRDFQTTKFSPDALEKLLGPSFESIRISESTLAGTVSPPPKALLGVFRRV
jgi:protein-L-isoaspartate O-methyltransferase